MTPSDPSSRPRIAVWKFASCDGCQLTLLDCEDELLPLTEQIDIAYFLGQNVPTDFRRANEEALLRRYHGGLQAKGVQGYSFDQCWDDYRGSMLMHVVSATQLQTLDGGNDRGQRLLDAMLTQGWQSAVDLDAGEFLSAF